MGRWRIIITTLAVCTSVTPAFAALPLQELRDAAAGSRAAAKEAARARWEELKVAREARREEINARMQQRREQIKAKVEGMRDERRKRIVERVQARLGTINERRMEHFDRVLERLSAILDKIASRTEKAKAKGKDVAAIESAIASARTAISTAQSAVDEQRTKTYQITVTDDGTARGEVEGVIKQLHADMKAVYDTVVAARQAVQSVFQQIKTIASSSAE